MQQSHSLKNSKPEENKQKIKSTSTCLNKMKQIIACADNYEAQKLASLIYVKDDKEIFINGILDIIENEIVISLKDKSAHSVLLQDRAQADIFADFIQS